MAHIYPGNCKIDFYLKKRWTEGKAPAFHGQTISSFICLAEERPVSQLPLIPPPPPPRRQRGPQEFCRLCLFRGDLEVSGNGQNAQTGGDGSGESAAEDVHDTVVVHIFAFANNSQFLAFAFGAVIEDVGSIQLNRAGGLKARLQFGTPGQQKRAQI